MQMQKDSMNATRYLFLHEVPTKVKVKSYDWNYYHVDKAT